MYAVFSLVLVYGYNSNTFIHNNSNTRNKQMEMNTCKILPFFKISRTHAWKMIHFSWFRNSHLPHWKKYPFFRENLYERGIRFGGEVVGWGGVGCWGGGGGEALGAIWYNDMISHNFFTVTSRKVSNAEDQWLEFFYCSQIWQASRWHFYRDVCQISKQYKHLTPCLAPSRHSEISR